MQETLSENLQALLLAAIDDAAFATDLNGVVIYWNNASVTLYGYAPNEVLHRSIYESIVPKTGEARAREIMTKLTDGSTWRGHLEMKRKDGGRFVAEMRAVPVARSDGKLEGIIALTRDMTEQVALEQQREELIAKLEETNRARGEFLSLISHELRTPLTTILGFSELLTRYEDDISREVLRESLIDIRDAARRMNRTVHDLLALGRLDVQGEVELDPVTLTSILESAISLHKDHHPERKVQYKAVEGQPQVFAKAAYLEHVFENLLSNAEKYSPKSEPIDVECVRQDNRLVVSVMDRGAGVEPEHLEHIFEPFYRTPEAANTFGVGLGLTVCRRLMELQHGEIWAEARQGGGSCFKVALPIMG